MAAYMYAFLRAYEVFGVRFGADNKPLTKQFYQEDGEQLWRVDCSVSLNSDTKSRPVPELMRGRSL
jgi:hypothetical protein